MNGLFRAAASALWIPVCLVASILPASAQSAGWSSVDVGSPQLAGSASQSGSTFTVSGAGADVWGTHDEFQFLHQRVTGDFDLQARIDSLTDPHWWSKAGVMVRDSLQSDSPHGFVLVSAGSGTAFQRRRAARGESVHTDGPFAGVPYWVKVSRRGSRLTAYLSRDGSSWTLVDSDTIALGQTVYAGLAVTSHAVAARATAKFSAVTLGSVAVPSGMANADVGSPAIPGSVQHAAGTYTITAAGTDIWDSSDQFHFVYQSVSGDFDVRARVASLQNTNTWTKAGLMIRESLAAGSRHAFAAVTGGAGFAFQRRTNTNGPSDHTDGAWTTAPGWVRLVRQGASVEAFHSSDGAAWRSMGRIPMALANTVLVGMAVTSHYAGRATVAQVDRWTLTAGGAAPANASPSISVTAPTDGASFQAGASVTVSAAASDPDGQVASVDFFANGSSLGSDATAPFSVQSATLVAGTHVLTAQATDNAGATTLSAPVTITVTAPASGGLPSGITSGDIGGPSLGGSVSYSGGTYTVQAGGRDIWDVADQFHFVHRQMTGDVDIRARVGSLANTHPWAKAGVMIRTSLAPGAAHAFMALTPDYGFALQHRPAASAQSIHTAGVDGRAPAWVRLTRIGTTLEGYRSQDGVTWTSVGRVSIPMGQTVYAGLAVASTTDAQRTVATFTGVTVAAAASSNPPPDPQPNPTPVPAPRAVAFVPSTDHATLVTRYELEIFAAGATPGSSSPVAKLDLGKPAPSAGEITVDCSAFFAGLASGNYQATVTAIGSSGTGRSAAVAFSK